MALKAGKRGVNKKQVDAYGNIDVGEHYTLPAATSDTLGGVKIGSGVNVDSSGEISVDPYTLPVATSASLGGVKPVAKTTDMTQDVGVDSEGKLYIEPPESGGNVYSKTFAANHKNGDMYYTDDVRVTGYTPIGVQVNSVYSGYSGVGGLFHRGNALVVFVYSAEGATDRFTTTVYYVADSDVHALT